MAYIGQVPVPQSTERRVEITATSGQTSFNVGTYAVGFADFYLNGVRLENADVTATDGTTVTLASGAAAGDVLTMVARTQTTDGSAGFASTSEVQGTHTTFSGSHSDTATTINLVSVSGISSGDYVVGEGITPGTTVSSVGASSIVISAGLDTDTVGIAGGEPISFYKANKVLSPGLVAGGLCRAWVNFNGTGTVAIRASFGVSSITDASIGDYIINYATAMPDANYCAVISGTRGGVRAEVTQQIDNTAYTSSSCRIGNSYTGGTAVDGSIMTLAVFR